MRFIVAAGGTGGHIFPAVAITETLQNQGHDVLYIGNKNSLEEEIVTKQNINFEAINVQKLYRSFTFKHLLFPFKLLKSILDCIKIFKKYEPDAFVGAGGFVSGPAGITAIMLKIPIFVQEQNSFPGLTNRKLKAYAKRSFSGMPGAEKYFTEKNVFSGNPIQTPIFYKDKAKIFNKYDLSENKKTLLVYCGSQGSSIINSNIEELLPQLVENGWNIIWQTGKNEFSQYKGLKKKGVHVFDFSYEKYELMNLADFAIARAGALTVAELEAMKIPTIFIPYPYSAGQHQLHNAKDAEKRNVGLVLEQKDLTPLHLLSVIKQLSTLKIDENHFCKHINAAENIVQIMLEELK